VFPARSRRFTDLNRDAEAGAQCSACTEHCAGAERGSGLEIAVSHEGRVAEQAILPWLASTFGFAVASAGVNSVLLDETKPSL
jgi:hypothetical protein